MVDQAKPRGLVRRQAPVVERHLHRQRLADGPRQALGAPRPRNNAQVDLRLPKLRRLRRDDHVAGERQLAAAAQRVPAHCRDHRLAHAAQPLPARDERHVDHLDRGGPRHLADVRSGGEGLLVAGDDHTADGVVGVHAFQGAHQFVHQRSGQRIERPRAIQPHQPYTLSRVLDKNVFVIHLNPP